MAQMDPWTHPALHRVRKLDPNLLDGLESMNGLGVLSPTMITDIVGMGVDLFKTREASKAAEEQAKATIAASQAQVQAARLELEAAKAQAEAQSLANQAAQARSEKEKLLFGLDTPTILWIGGGALVLVVALTFMRGRRRR